MLPSEANVQRHGVLLQLKLCLCCFHTLQAFQKGDDESYNLQLSTTNEKPLSSMLFMVPSPAMPRTLLLFFLNVKVRWEPQDRHAALMYCGRLVPALFGCVMYVIRQEPVI